jgi:RNA polymerase sigma-70 factor (ECF subfamily)
VTEPDSATFDADESISMALLLMLERLKPLERAVFLLSEVFDYRHSEIAAVLGLSKANCRQLLRRARQQIHMARPRFNASAREHIELLERFLHAAASGNMNELLTLLASNIVLHSDGGGKAPALPRPIYGPENVARAITHGMKKRATQNIVQQVVRMNGEPGIVTYIGGRPQSAFIVQVSDARVEAIYIVTNPDKLSHLRRLE